MKKLGDMLKNSAMELKNLRSFTGLSMLLAISIVLSYFLRVDLAPTMSIGFAFIATGLMGMLYGPVAAGVAAGVGDVIKYMLRPRGPFFFGFTLNVIIAGAIYGFCLYKKKPTFLRAAVAKTAVNILVNSVLNTYFMSVLYGDAFGVMILPRIIKNAVMLPIEIPLLYFSLLAAYNALKKAGYIKF